MYSVTNLDSFGVEHIQGEIKRFIANKSIKNIFRIRIHDSIRNGYFCIGFDFMFNGKFYVLFSPHNFKMNDKLILYYLLK